MTASHEIPEFTRYRATRLPRRALTASPFGPTISGAKWALKRRPRSPWRRGTMDRCISRPPAHIGKPFAPPAGFTPCFSHAVPMHRSCDDSPAHFASPTDSSRRPNVFAGPTGRPLGAEDPSGARARRKRFFGALFFESSLISRSGGARCRATWKAAAHFPGISKNPESADSGTVEFFESAQEPRSSSTKRMGTKYCDKEVAFPKNYSPTNTFIYYRGCRGQRASSGAQG